MTVDKVAGVMKGNGEFSVEYLIMLVESKAHLYDKRRPEYKDAALKMDTWNEIGETLDVPGPVASAKWKTLRERYARERKQMQSKMMQGSTDITCTWPYFNNLRFLDPFILPRSHKNKDRSANRGASSEHANHDVHSSLSLTEEPIEYFEESDSDIDDLPVVTITKRRKTSEAGGSKEVEVLLKSISDIAETMKMNEERRHQTELREEMTEDDFFGKEIAAELKKIKNGKVKRTLKMKIYSLLAEMDDEAS